MLLKLCYKLSIEYLIKISYYSANEKRKYKNITSVLCGRKRGWVCIHLLDSYEIKSSSNANDTKLIVYEIKEYKMTRNGSDIKILPCV
jgi:hypothetical protein